MYVIKRNDGRYVSSRQIMFRPMQYTDSKRNAAKFKSKETAIVYMKMNCYGDCKVIQV
jgi:hypothetical protein